MNWTTVVVAFLSSGGALGVGIAARRPKADSKRETFTAVTDRMEKEISRLDDRITAQESTIRGQSTAIGYMSGWIRGLVMFIRIQGLEPPPAPPIPDDARPFMHDIGV